MRLPALRRIQVHNPSKTAVATVRTFSTTANMGSVYIKRSTFFKVPNDEDIEKVLAAYKVLRATAVKVNLALLSYT